MDKPETSTRPSGPSRLHDGQTIEMVTVPTKVGYWGIKPKIRVDSFEKKRGTGDKSREEQAMAKWRVCVVHVLFRSR